MSTVHRGNMSTPSSIIVTMPPTSDTSKLPPDQDNQIVYKKDLEKALEDFEKKHNIMNDQEAMQPLLKKDLWMALEYCNHGTRSSEVDYPTRGKERNLIDIINTFKKSGQIHGNIPKPNEEELSWLKIKVPA